LGATDFLEKSLVASMKWGLFALQAIAGSVTQLRGIAATCEERTRAFGWDRSADHIRASSQNGCI
jgi:hypothetical protein